MSNLPIGEVLCGDALEVLKSFPDESISCCITSPPYWSLRDYQVPGQLGLESTFQEYITKLCDIFDEVKRVLRKDGTCFINLGDTYAGSMCGYGATKNSKTGFQKAPINAGFYASSKQKPPSAKAIYHEIVRYEGRGKTKEVPAKSLCQIPSRFAIEMVDRGWILRNRLIWWKRNCMPSSVSDRFTIDYEDVFYFTKSNDTQYWTNEKTLQCVSKQPPGIHGIEGQDWEWISCPNCKGTGKSKINVENRPEIYGEEDVKNERRGRVRDFLDKKNEMYQAGNKPCNRCKETGKIKHNFWSGHDYWFEQQFESVLPESQERSDREQSNPDKYYKADNSTLLQTGFSMKLKGLR